MTSTVFERIARIAVLIALLAIAVLVTLLSSLGDVDQRIGDRRYLSQTVSKGPALIQGIEWRLDSLRTYTRLADKEGEQLELEAPANATIVVAEISLIPTDRANVDLVTSCTPELLDDRGNLWPMQDSGLYGYPMETRCSDDLRMEPGKTSKFAAIYVVPKEAVAHLLGIAAPEAGTVNYRTKERVLITP